MPHFRVKCPLEGQKKSKRGNPSCDVDPKLAKVSRRKQLRIQNQVKKSTECYPRNRSQGIDDDVNTQQETECEVYKNKEEKRKNISLMRREARRVQWDNVKREKDLQEQRRKEKEESKEHKQQLKQSIIEESLPSR